jgi:hypothetical protein
MLSSTSPSSDRTGSGSVFGKGRPVAGIKASGKSITFNVLLFVCDRTFDAGRQTLRSFLSASRFLATRACGTRSDDTPSAIGGFVRHAVSACAEVNTQIEAAI